MSSARAAFDRGLGGQATILYGQALNRARAMDRASLIADAAYNLAAALVGEGKFGEARVALREAEDELLREGADPSDVLLLHAKVARMLDDRSAATAYADRVLAGWGKTPASPGNRVQAQVIKGEIAADAGDNAGATAALREAERAAGQVPGGPGPALLAGVTGLQARLEQAGGNAMAAAASFDRQAALLRDAGRYGDMVSAMSRAGENYDATGAHAEASLRLFRAARAAAAQGKAIDAQKLFAAAASAAAAAGDTTFVQRNGPLNEAIPRGSSTQPDVP